MNRCPSVAEAALATFRGQIPTVSTKRIRRPDVRRTLNESKATKVQVVYGLGFTYYRYTTEDGSVGSVTVSKTGLR